MNQDSERIKCVYCHNPSPIVASLSTWDKKTIKSLGLSHYVNIERGSENAYNFNINQSSLLIKCMACQKKYFLLCPTQNECKDFVQQLINNSSIDGNKKDEIKGFMENNNIQQEYILCNSFPVVLNLIGKKQYIEILFDIYYLRLKLIKHANTKSVQYKVVEMYYLNRRDGGDNFLDI